MRRVFFGRFLILLVSFLFQSALPCFAAETAGASSSDADSRMVGPVTPASEFLDETAEPLSEGAPPARPPFEATAYGSEDLKKSEKEEKGELLPGGRIRISGKYRLAAGIDSEDFIVNDSWANNNMFTLQGPNSDYLFGERQNNTFDKAIYSQHLLNIDFSPVDPINFYTQIVNDPWSWVGTTGDQYQQTDPGDATVRLRYNLKYLGSFNSTISEIYRDNIGNRFNIPAIKIHSGHTTATAISGLSSYAVPPVQLREVDIDFDYKPIRKLWMDITEDQWNLRVFALADETQALTTDDPLQLSNHKDYWQASPWLYEYKPAQFFLNIDNQDTFKRGYYSDALSFLARDSEGNRLVLLRGASFEGNFDKAYIASTVAAPITPWDDEYFKVNNLPWATRVKYQLTDQLTTGSTHTLRGGFVDSEWVDRGQVWALDGEYVFNQNIKLKGEAARSYREQDLRQQKFLLQSNSPVAINRDGYAYKVVLETRFDHAAASGHTEVDLSWTRMDKHFQPLLSRYLETRDDAFWGNHISFVDKPDLEFFRIGDGVDVNRSVIRAQWREKLFTDRFYNLFDTRYVTKQTGSDYVETVIRDEVTLKLTSRLTGKGLIRWRGLPKTTANIEPSLTDFYFPKDDIDIQDFTIQNTAVAGGRDADQHTYSLGLQYVVNSELTAEGILERSNAIPDFPRGLLADFFQSSNDRVEGLLLDHMQTFLYGQASLHSVPPYPYFTMTKERLIYAPDERSTYTLHATQNSYEFASGLDDNINHIGLSATLIYSKKLSLFFDYTYSHQIDVPKLIATNLAEASYEGHHNFYANVDYRINPNQLLRIEYGVFGWGTNGPDVNPYSTSSFMLPTIDIEHLLRVSLSGDF